MKKVIPLLLLTLGMFFSSQAQVLNYSVGDVCPDFTVTDINGQSHNLYSITASGKYVMLDFFFTTCPPCQATVPYFSELHEKYGCNQGQLFCLSIDNGDTDAEVAAFETTYGGSFAHAPAASGTQGGGNAVVSTIGIAAYPTYTLIGPDNKFINIDIWPVSSMQDFEAAFPANSGITPQNCTSVSVEEEIAEPVVQMYPNPAGQSTRLAMRFESAGDAAVAVYDLRGKKVIDLALGTVNAQLEEQVLDLSELEAGMYLVQVRLNQEVLATEKLNVIR